MVLLQELIKNIYIGGILMLSEQNANFLKQLAKMMTTQFGEDCKVVLYEVDENKTIHTITTVEAGLVKTSSDSTPPQFILNILQKDPKEIQDRYSELTRTQQGQILKTSTLFYKGTSGQIEAIFMINFDISSLYAAENALHKLTAANKKEEPKQNLDSAFQDVNTVLEELIKEADNLIGKPAALMTKDDKIKSIQFLNNKGAFLITKSGDKIARHFNISKYTLYKYIG